MTGIKGDHPGSWLPHMCSFIYFTLLLFLCLRGEGVRRGKLGLAQLVGTARSSVMLQGLHWGDNSPEPPWLRQFESSVHPFGKLSL